MLNFYIAYVLVALITQFRGEAVGLKKPELSQAFNFAPVASGWQPNPEGFSDTLLRWTSGGLDPKNPDNSRALQAACDSIIQAAGSRSIVLQLPSGRYNFLHPIILQRYDSMRNIYIPFTIRLQGEGTYSEADGFGTILDFSQVKGSFAVGIQGGKGVEISGIEIIMGWWYKVPSAYWFYNNPQDNNGLRNTRNDPSCAFAIDPFGPVLPTDGGYQGNDAYGRPLTRYYRGSSNGSTGTTIHDIKFQNCLVGFITSPSGKTYNAELCHFYNLNFQNVRYWVIGCQPEEKLNEVDHVEGWGVTDICFQLGTYGLGQPGNWHFHHINIAGYVRQLNYFNEGGFFPVYEDHIYAETLGSLGYWSSANGSSFSESSINFANYIDATFCYTNGQIAGQGVAYNNCQFRMYGTYNPVTINNVDGYNVFNNCSFDKVPYYNTDYPVGHIAFNQCKFGGVQASNPKGILASIDSTAHGFEPTYLITDSLVGKYYQAIIPCVGNELSRVKVGTIIVAYNTLFIQQGIAGVVTKIGQQSFTLCYIPPQIVSGQKYYLFLWRQSLND